MQEGQAGPRRHGQLVELGGHQRPGSGLDQGRHDRLVLHVGAQPFDHQLARGHRDPLVRLGVEDGPARGQERHVDHRRRRRRVVEGEVEEAAGGRPAGEVPLGRHLGHARGRAPTLRPGHHGGARHPAGGERERRRRRTGREPCRRIDHEGAEGGDDDPGLDGTGRLRHGGLQPGGRRPGGVGQHDGRRGARPGVGPRTGRAEERRGVRPDRSDDDAGARRGGRRGGGRRGERGHGGDTQDDGCHNDERRSAAGHGAGGDPTPGDPGQAPGRLRTRRRIGHIVRAGAGRAGRGLRVDVGRCHGVGGCDTVVLVTTRAGHPSSPCSSDQASSSGSAWRERPCDQLRGRPTRSHSRRIRRRSTRAASARTHASTE